MIIPEKKILKWFVVFCLIALTSANQRVFSQDLNQSKNYWYCDERLNKDLRFGTVIETTSYNKKTSAPVLANFIQEGVKYKTIDVIKVQIFDIYTNSQTSQIQEFYNVKIKDIKPIKFEIGKKYLFEIKSFHTLPQAKNSESYLFISPQGMTKLFESAKADITFMKNTENLNLYQEIFGTNEGENIPAGIIGSKFTNFVKPIYPEKLKKIKESIKVAVLISEDGKVLKAKAVCAKNSALARVSEEAALASKFSPTIKDGMLIKIKGIIIYNFNP